MTSIGQALSTFKPGPSATDAAPVPALAPAPLKRLFDALHVTLNVKFDDLFAGGDDLAVMQEWAKALAGYRGDEIRRGLSTPWKFAPTLGEFMIACRPALDPEAAWLEARRCLAQRDAGHIGDWTHPAIWRAACTMSPAVRTGEYQQHRARWKDELATELRAGWKEGVPPVPPKLELHPGKPADPDSFVVREAKGMAQRLKRELAARQAAAALEGGAA